MSATSEIAALPLNTLSRARYLPDFWLPDLNVWCEVKGNLQVDELQSLTLAASQMGLPPSPHVEHCPKDYGWPWVERILLLGNVPEPGAGWAHARLDIFMEDLVVAQRVFFATTVTNKIVTMRIGDPIPLNQYTVGEKPAGGLLRDLNHGWPMPIVLQGSVSDAYRAARSARFEYGESGAKS